MNKKIYDQNNENFMNKAYPMRYPTRAAIDSLAKRFDLPNTVNMQDWEYEVADPNRIDDFINAYISNQLNEDEKFVLMETILQSFEESTKNLTSDQQWKSTLQLLENNLALHATTICYWALDEELLELCWKITPYLREIRIRNHLKTIE